MKSLGTCVGCSPSATRPTSDELHTTTVHRPGNAVSTLVDAASKNRDKEWIEDEYAPLPSQPTSKLGCYGKGGTRGTSGRGHGLGNYQRPNASRPDAEVIVVPVKDVARIIGKGGSRIHELQDSSGAYIWVKKDDADNYFETKIKLSDPEEACRKARELIDAIVHPPEEPACSSKSEEPPPLLNWDKLLAKSDEDTKKRWASLTPIIKNFYDN
ncbi:hypothetical protein HPB49_025886 [Dermacentor silvarum]|nr:hypothetical protein HPB49_025886 [Dermacentor silvarum]